MRLRTIFFAAAAGFLVSGRATAETSDPVAARAQLQQGFALKEKGKCSEAIAHFEESLKLDRQPKALLNLADCEEKLGRLAAAQTHFVEARDLARMQGVEPLSALADQHLRTVEKRMPKLVVRLGPDAPADTAVTRDGVPLGTVSLNSPLPIDVGKHTLLARGGGFQRQYEVTLTEAQTMDLVVTPMGGERIAASPEAPATSRAVLVSPPPSPGSGTLVAEPEPVQSDSSIKNPQRIAGFGAIGVGVVGLAVGTVFGLKFSRKNDDLGGICPTGQKCSPDGVAQYNSTLDEVRTARTWSIIGLGGGAVLTGVGAILVLTAPKSQQPRTGIWLLPGVGMGGAGATLVSRW
jgi:hypothetical protein